MPRDTSKHIMASKAHLARMRPSLEETNDLLRATMTTIASTHAALDLLEQIMRTQVGGAPRAPAPRPRRRRQSP